MKILSEPPRASDASLQGQQSVRGVSVCPPPVMPLMHASLPQACKTEKVGKVNDNTKMLRAMKTLRLLKLCLG